MSTIRKLVRAQINTLGDDEVEVVMSTAALARDGHILLPQGCVADNYRANPIVLWSHDPDHPVGNNENLVVEPAQISARTRFAPTGISRKADEVRGLVKAGVIRAVSIGFEIIECEPLDPKKPRGGQRITQWELLEMSFVSVPADVGAVVTARANGEQSMTDETRAALLLAPAGAAPATRAHGVRGKLVLSRGLYQVAELCWLFQELGWHVDMAKYESDFEGDESKVPGMLASVLHDLGGALLAMTQEEIAEALAGHDVELVDVDVDPADAVLVVEERAHIAAAKTPAIRAWRRGLAHAKLRAGKTLSADTVRCLQEMQDSHQAGMDHARSAMKAHKAGIDSAQDLMDRAGVSDAADDTTQTVQTSDGTETSEGAENGRSFDFRRRQADLLALAGA
jgi:HK97 family phage prohead protease